MEMGQALLDEFLLAPLRTAWNQFILFMPSILGALVILLIGGIVAKLIEQVIVRGLKILTLDKIAEQIQLSAMLARGGVRRKPTELVGAIVYWIVMLAFVMAAINALGLVVAAQLLEQVIAFLPNVVAAVFLLIVGIFSAAFLATIVRTAASNAGILQAHLLGQVVQTIVVVFAIVTALQQLKIEFLGDAFLIILAGVSLGSALAFGLGCKDLAGRWVSGLAEQLTSKKR